LRALPQRWFFRWREKRARFCRWHSQPEMAILDETDSGLDIDALRVVSDGVNALTGRILDAGHHALSAFAELHQAHFVHVMMAAVSSNRRTRSGAFSRRARLRLDRENRRNSITCHCEPPMMSNVVYRNRGGVAISST